MKEKIRIFLDTDLLEKYLLGTTSAEETMQVERYIAMYPAVRKTYMSCRRISKHLQNCMLLRLRKVLKPRFLIEIKAQNTGRRKFQRYAIAASIAAMLFAGSSYFFWNQNQNLQDENVIVNNRIRTLEEDMKEQLEDVRNQFIVLNNPQTKKYAVNGNKKAKELKAVAYINPVKKLSYINVRNLPNLPDNQCYQMWAEVNGKMVNLGVIKNVDDKDRLRPLPYAENAVSYITIEPQGGNDTPTVKNIVANISY